MKRYRIVYWLGSMITEWLVRAETEEEAVDRFKEIKGDKPIVKIEEV